MKTEKRLKKPENRGFTLIELVVVIGIIGIFAGVLGRYITTGSGLFRSVSGTTRSQMDSQEAADALEDLILDANKAIYYNHVDDMSGSGSLTDEPGTITIIRQNSAGKAVKDVITYKASDDTLSLSRTVSAPPSEGGGTESGGTGTADISSDTTFTDALLAENIVDFRMDVSQAASGIVRFRLVAENHGKSVTVKRSVSLRNKVKVTDDLNEAFSETTLTPTPIPETT